MKPLWKHQERDIERYKQDANLLNFSDPGCVSADTEFLTPVGWKQISAYQAGDQVAQFDPQEKTISFVAPISYVKRPCSEFYHINPCRGTSQVFSSEHNVLYYDKSGAFNKCSMADYYAWHTAIPSSDRVKNPRKFETTFSVINDTELNLSDQEIRVMVMLIADGSFPTHTNRCVVRVKKLRKIERAKMLLSDAGIKFKVHENSPYDPEYARFFFQAPRREKDFTEDWWQASQRQLEIVADEVQYWDSSNSSRPSNNTRFSSYKKTTAEFVQYAFNASKRPTSFISRSRARRDKIETEYVVTARRAHTLVGPGRPTSIKKIPSLDGFKYCFEVPTGCLLLRHNGYIFATGNTGKTRTLIETIKHHQIPTLILAPKSILQVAWGNDINEFAPDLEYSVAYAHNRADAFNERKQVVITNHDAAKWLIDNPRYFSRFRDGMIVIDESTCAKNPKAQRSHAMAQLRQQVQYCTCMTGTPTPQGIIDIWHQALLVDQGERLGRSFWKFKNMTYTPVNAGAFTKWEEKPGVADAVMDILGDIIIRNRRDDCMDLPENQTVHRMFQLSDSHRRTYDQLRRRAVVELETGNVAAINKAVLLQKLLQVASGAVYDEYGEYHKVSTERYELVMDLVDERDHSVVVFNWKHQRDLMVEIAKKRGYEYSFIDGSANDKQREQAVNDFQAGKLRCLFIHPQSAGHGITLTKGCATIWASPTYNAELFEQANARIYRGGQTRKTETILISAANTADIAAYDALMKKVTNMHELLEMVI